MSSNEKDIVYEIVKHVGVIADYSTGWKKEINLVSWNSNTPKIDIRDWNPDHEHMSRGITLHIEEAKKMQELLSDYFDESKDTKSKTKN